MSKNMDELWAALVHPGLPYGMHAVEVGPDRIKVYSDVGGVVVWVGSTPRANLPTLPNGRKAGPLYVQEPGTDVDPIEDRYRDPRECASHARRVIAEHAAAVDAGEWDVDRVAADWPWSFGAAP
jgi:hypothetical protein